MAPTTTTTTTTADGSESGAEGPGGSPAARSEPDRTVAAGATVESLLPALLDGAEALTVVDAEGRSVGVVTRAAVARALG